MPPLGGARRSAAGGLRVRLSSPTACMVGWSEMYSTQPWGDWCDMREDARSAFCICEAGALPC